MYEKSQINQFHIAKHENSCYDLHTRTKQLSQNINTTN